MASAPGPLHSRRLTARATPDQHLPTVVRTRVARRTGKLADW